jgi:hypothetical protein
MATKQPLPIALDIYWRKRECVVKDFLVTV